MSIAPRNSSQFRNDSGELVVFEAARYFSGGDDNSSCFGNSSSVFPHHDGGRPAARMSLDMPAISADNIPAIHKQYLTREKKKYKQPSSPGGRLASFLNSLFNQASSKKKKKSKTSGGGAAASDREECYSHDRRRSSISHIRITTSSASSYQQDPNSPYSAAATPPPPYAKTPTKSSYGDLKISSDLRKAVPPHKNGDNAAQIEQFRFNDERFRNPTTKRTAWDEDKRKFEKFSDGEDSDSSSDLFDLPNLDFYSRDLPVYGTTDMGRIRIGAPTATA